MYTRELLIIQFYPLDCYFLPLLDKMLSLAQSTQTLPIYDFPLGRKPKLQANK
jgi:hypothetical protein